MESTMDTKSSEVLDDDAIEVPFHTGKKKERKQKTENEQINKRAGKR